jgi:hypothetical protein
MRPNRLFVAGLALVLAGAVLPFLMVIGVLPSSLWLNFVAYISSVAGLFLGILSAAAFVAVRRRGDEEDHGGEV